MFATDAQYHVVLGVLQYGKQTTKPVALPTTRPDSVAPAQVVELNVVKVRPPLRAASRSAFICRLLLDPQSTADQGYVRAADSHARCLPASLSCWPRASAAP